VRAADDALTFTRVAADELVEATVRVARGESERLPDGKVAVIAAEAMTGAIAQELGIAASGRHTAAILDEQIAVINVDEARGLEFDSVVITEPTAIVSDFGLRGLYVALTRSTQRLVVVHAADLPQALGV
jgi:DNA helicase IV